MAKKILCVLRVSTIQQEIESQKRDMVSFLQNKSYGEDEIEWIEAEGASAIKADSKYLEMLDGIKTIVSNSNTIKAVAFWHLNRLGRKKTYLDYMVNWFRDNHIQLYTKVPELTLLNADLSENPSATLVLSVFCAMMENETNEILQKTKRGREYKKSQGGWLGGNLAFGFKVMNKQLVVDEEKMELIREIYSMYATGRYSYRTLWNELQSLGKDIKYNTMVTLLQANRRAIYAPYVGDYEHTPQLSRSYKHENLTIGLLKCPNCGCSYTLKNGVYRCVHQTKQFAYAKCDAPSISAKNLDTLLKDVTWLGLDAEYGKIGTKEIAELTEENERLSIKISTSQSKLEQLKVKGDRLKELYADGDYSKAQYESKKEMNNKEIEDVSDNIKLFQSKLRNNKISIENIDKESAVTYKEYVRNIVIDKPTIDRFITKVEIERKNKYVLTIKIHVVNGNVFEFEYNYKKWRYESQFETARKAILGLDDKVRIKYVQ